MNYLALIDEESQGPITVPDLYVMEMDGLIADSTFIREESSEAWITWQELKGQLATSPGRPAPFIRRSNFPPQPPMVQSSSSSPSKSDWRTPIEKRQALRGDTAYPFARRLIQAIMFLCLIAAAAIWIVAFSFMPDGSTWFALAIATTLSAAVYWALALVGLALLDISDSHLTRL